MSIPDPHRRVDLLRGRPEGGHSAFGVTASQHPVPSRDPQRRLGHAAFGSCTQLTGVSLSPVHLIRPEASGSDRLQPGYEQATARTFEAHRLPTRTRGALHLERATAPSPPPHRDGVLQTDTMRINEARGPLRAIRSAPNRRHCGVGGRRPPPGHPCRTTATRPLPDSPCRLQGHSPMPPHAEAVRPAHERRNAVPGPHRPVVADA